MRRPLRENCPVCNQPHPCWCGRPKVLTWQSPQHTCLHLFTSTVATPMGNGRTRYVTTCNSCFAVLIDYEG